MNEPAQLGDREQRILDFVQQRTGLYIRSAQHQHAASAIGRAMRKAGSSDPRAYVSRLERDMAALDELIIELVVGETYFFRFPDQFRFLAQTILPELVGRLRETAIMRFWSAGCATGEEAYSLAIVLEEAGLLSRARILGTDISKAAIEQAGRGVFHDWALRGEGQSRVMPHATRRDGSYVLHSELRQAVHFRCLNLARDAYPPVAGGTGHQDVIFCRNVLIYLKPSTIGQVAAKLYQSLSPGGWLVTAASDPQLDAHVPFEMVQGPRGVYYRRPLNDATEPERPAPAGAATAQPASRIEPEDGHQDIRHDAQPAIVELARDALAAGHYRRAAELTADAAADIDLACLHVKALANSDTESALAACDELLNVHPLSTALHYLNAILLMELHRDREALGMIKRVLCLDRSLVIAHMALGTLLRRGGNLPGAQRAFRNARDLCQHEDETGAVPLTDDETFGSILIAANHQIASLGDSREETP